MSEPLMSKFKTLGVRKPPPAVPLPQVPTIDLLDFGLSLFGDEILEQSSKVKLPDSPNISDYESFESSVIHRFPNMTLENMVRVKVLPTPPRSLSRRKKIAGFLSRIACAKSRKHC